MTIEQELRLSYYRQVADINAEHCISLVQDVRTNKFYVKKLLTTYNAAIYRHLQSHPIPNTPRIFVVEEDQGILTVIEEYIPGDTLEELLERHGTLPEEQVIRITTELLTILSAFHGRTPAIVNRDIKPSNIKLSPDGVVKLLDMNAAKWVSREADKDTVLLGTQGYAAPEQYGFGPSSALSDIYAVGVLMNVMLTGVLPGSRLAGGRLGNIIEKCVALSPGDRYQNVAQLLSALGGQPSEIPGWRKFLPPGFRSGNPMTWLFSAVGYVFLFYCGLSLQTKNAGIAEQWLNRIAFTVTMLCIVLFNGNYLNVHRFFPQTRSKDRRRRWLGMAMVDFALMTVWVLIMGLLVNLFLR